MSTPPLSPTDPVAQLNSGAPSRIPPPVPPRSPLSLSLSKIILNREDTLKVHLPPLRPRSTPFLPIDFGSESEAEETASTVFDRVIEETINEEKEDSLTTPRTILSPRFAPSSSSLTNLALLESIRKTYQGTFEQLSLQQLDERMNFFYDMCIVMAAHQKDNAPIHLQIEQMIKSKDSFLLCYIRHHCRFFKRPLLNGNTLFGQNLKRTIDNLINLEATENGYLNAIMNELSKYQESQTGQVLSYILFGEKEQEQINPLIALLEKWNLLEQRKIISDIQEIQKSPVIEWKDTKTFDPSLSDFRRSVYPDNSTCPILPIMIDSTPLRQTNFKSREDYLCALFKIFRKRKLLEVDDNQLNKIVDLFLEAEDILGSSREMSEEEKMGHTEESLKNIETRRQIEVQRNQAKKELPQPFFNMISGGTIGSMATPIMLFRQTFYKYKSFNEPTQGQQFALKFEPPGSLYYSTTLQYCIRPFSSTIFRVSDVDRNFPLAKVSLVWFFICDNNEPPQGYVRITNCHFYTERENLNEEGKEIRILLKLKTKKLPSFSIPFKKKKKSKFSSTPTSPRREFVISTQLPDTPSPRDDEPSPKKSPTAIGRSFSLTHPSPSSSTPRVKDDSSQ